MYYNSYLSLIVFLVYVYVYVYIYMCVCMYACVCVCVYVYVVCIISHEPELRFPQISARGHHMHYGGCGIHPAF